MPQDDARGQGTEMTLDKDSKTGGDALNRKVDQQARDVPTDLPAGDGPKRRTWEGFADDYRALSEELVEVSRRQQEAQAQIAALEQQLGAKDGDFRRLKAQRQKDLERLAAVSRTRDLLEKRSAAQMAKVAAALARPAPPAPAPVAAAAPVAIAPVVADSAAPAPNMPEPQQAAGFVARIAEVQSPQSLGWSTKRWWLRTVSMAQTAYKERRLGDAQLLFEAALLTRQTASLWDQLGHVLRESAQYLEGELAYRRSLRLSPDRGEILFLAGYCLEMAGRYGEAVPYYEAAMARDASLANRYEHLRDFRARLGH